MTLAKDNIRTHAKTIPWKSIRCTKSSVYRLLQVNIFFHDKMRNFKLD